MFKKKEQKTKKLKAKLQLIISLVLFIQIIIISTLSIFLFHQQISRSAKDELTQDLKQTRASIESLKRDLFNRMFLLRYTIEEIPLEELTRDTLYKNIHTHFTSIDTDRVVLLTGKGELIFQIEKRKEKFAPIEQSLDLSQFNFVKSMYTLGLSSQRNLFLITGTRIYHPTGAHYYLLFINSLDKDFANYLYKQTGINFVLFVQNKPICSVVPDFNLPEGSENSFTEIKVGATPYRIHTELLSSEVPGGLKLTVLRSSLQDSLYLRWLNTIFIVSFIVTLIISLAYIVG